MPTSPFASLSISHQFFQTHTARIAALFLFQIPQNPVPPRHAQSETRLGNLDQENPKNQLPYDEENHERFVPRNRISCNDGPRSLPNVFLDAPVHRRYSILWRRDTRKVILPSQPCPPYGHVLSWSQRTLGSWCWHVSGYGYKGVGRCPICGCRVGLAAFIIVGFARDQQNKVSKVFVVDGSNAEWDGFGNYLSTIIYVDCVRQLQAGAR